MHILIVYFLHGTTQIKCLIIMDFICNMVRQIYHAELQLNKVNTSDTEALLLDLH